jgi:serine/threonine protein kinase
LDSAVSSVFRGSSRFRPIDVLGRGAMGIVHRALDEETGAEVALKTLPELTPEQIYRLKQEFRALTGITHPNLVELYELVVSESACFFTMELVRGVAFLDFLRDRVRGEVDGGLDLSESACVHFRGLLRQIVLGLAALHGAGKLHRDVKPSNIMVDRDQRVVLLDFGLSTALRGNRPGDDELGVVAGTPAYMAPEQSWGMPLTPAADWFALGVVLYEVLSGRSPFDGSAAEMLFAKENLPPPLLGKRNPRVPRALERLVEGLLDAKPERRPGAREILEYLDSDDLSGGFAAAPIRPSGASPPLEPLARTFVGREDEIERLESTFTTVRYGTPAIAHVLGASGIGKTELVRTFLSTLEERPETLVLRGSCRPNESVPYKALDTLVDELSRFLLSRPEAAATLSAPQAAALVRVFPVLGRVPSLAGGTPPPEEPEPHELRRRGFKALREVLAAIARERPLVLWIDDLHWGDLDSAAVLREILRPPDPPPLLLLLSYRGDHREDIPALAALENTFAELPREWTREISLGPLAPDERRELARRLCPVEAQPLEHIEAIARESDGSPFLIGELARHLAAAALSGGTTRPLPAAGLGEALGARLRGLSSAASGLLEVVAIAARPVDRSLALAAAGLAERERPILARLAQACLVRPTSLGERAAVEVYHDRIRELVVAGLAPEVVRKRHLEIARVLESRPEADPHALFEHYLGAGENELAGRHGLEAAERAARALAFEQAAGIYRRVLELEPGEVERWSLLGKLAEALGNAGRGREAADAYASAVRELGARPANAEQALAMRRSAAEHYLRSGHLEQGTAAIRDVLSGAGVKFPRSSGGALASALILRVRLGRRGLGFERRPASEIDTRTRVRLEACWAASSSLTSVDPVIADVLGLRHLLAALDAGELSHVSRALGSEASKAAQIGGRFMRRRCARLLALMEEVCRETGRIYDVAHFHVVAGVVAYQTSQWRRAHEECEAGIAILRERCTGVSWELVTSEAFSLSALGHKGEIATLARRIPAAIAEADQRGDLYASVGLRAGILNLIWLAEDRPDLAAEQAEQALVRWPGGERFQVQHYLHLIAMVHAHLYEGRPWEAWRQILAAWPRLRRALFLRMESPRVELRNLRARTALACVAAAQVPVPSSGDRPEAGWPVKRLLRVAEEDARAIELDRGVASSLAFANLIRAGVAGAEHRDRDAVRMLEVAGERLAAIDMGLYAAAAAHREGALRGGDEGRRRRDQGDAWMQSQAIRDPASMARVFAPGPLT